MATMYTELANALALYQTTIANAANGTGSYYSIDISLNEVDAPDISDPASFTLLDDGITYPILDGTGNVAYQVWAPLTNGFSFTLTPPDSSE